MARDDCRYASLADLEADPALSSDALAEILDFASQLVEQLERERAAVRIVRAAVEAKP